MRRAIAWERQSDFSSMEVHTQLQQGAQDRQGSKSPAFSLISGGTDHRFDPYRMVHASFRTDPDKTHPPKQCRGWGVGSRREAGTAAWLHGDPPPDTHRAEAT